MIASSQAGLIFTRIGKGLGVINDAVFSAIVIITAPITPIPLKWSPEPGDIQQ